MTTLKPCPFCGGEATERDFKSPFTDGWVGCRECHIFIDRAKDGKPAAVAAWNRRAQPANEPLTLKQLRQMDGEPVWCADGEGHSCYCLVNAESEDCIDSECGAWCFGFYGMTGDGENGLHNMGWLAYAHKPGGEQE